MDNEKWRTLYRAGALAPLIALLLYSSQFIILIFGEPYPATTEGWFALFQRSKLLGLWYLNALDILSWALLGLMFLALYVALRRIRPAWMLIALYLALLGVVVFIVPRVLTLSVVTISDLHAAATTETQRTLYLTVGETLSRLVTDTPQTTGWQFMAAGGLIVSIVILQSSGFTRVAGYVGIAGFVLSMANYISWILDLPIRPALMAINGLTWLVWWLIISASLFRLSRRASADASSAAAG